MRIRELVACVAVAASACAGPGNYVWVQDLPAQPSAGSEYLIAPGDVVSIHVLNQESMATRVRVRPDGRIEVPLLGDVEVGGKRPSSLRSELEARLKDYIVAPVVTVNVEEFAPVVVSVLGEVVRPGAVQLEHGKGVAQALASVGGLTDYADRDRIFVVRSGSKPMRVRFTYEAITRGDTAAARFVLRSGDVVVAE